MDSVATLLSCFEALCKNLALAPDAAAGRRLQEADTQGALEQVILLLRDGGLRPRLIAGRRELPEQYEGPLLAMIDRRSWVYVPAYGSGAQETLEIFDPQAGGAVTVPCAQFRQRWDGPAVLCAPPQAARPARRLPEGLQCLCVVGRHHGLDLDEARLAHAHAIDGDTVSLPQLLEIARACGLRGRIRPLSWERALAFHDVFPVLAATRAGDCAILCNIQKTDDGETGIQALFPAAGDASSPASLRLLDRAAFEAAFAGTALLLKRRRAIDDPDQPFGLSWFLPEFLRHKQVFAQIALAVAIITVISLLTPLFFQLVIDKVLPHRTYATLNVLAAGMAGAILYNCALEFLKNYLLLFATSKIDIMLSLRTFRHLMRLPLSFFESVPAGLILKHMQQTEKIRGFLSGNLFFTLLDLCSLLIFLPFLFLYSPALTAVVFGFSLLIALVVVALIRPFQKRLDILYATEGKRQSCLVESIRGIHTIKSLALEPRREKEWNDTTAFAVQSCFNVGKISVTARTLSQALEMLMNIAVVWYGAHLVFDMQISIGALVAFQMISARVSSPLVRFVSLIHEYQQIALSVRMLGVVMNSRPESDGGRLCPEIRGDIEFHEATFRYRPDLQPALDAVSLRVAPGEILGIVGRSGSGKSTIAKLVQAIYAPQEGFLRMDGTDIRELDKAHLRSNIGVVLQENYFFHGTIRDNIRLARPDATPEDVIAAARLAGAHEFISSLHTGYDTVLEENAVNLSGGQKQRLAIARALLTSPRILILDEATSALDPESEWDISRNLRQMAQGRTVLMIAHRLSLMRHAHRVIVLDRGRIVQQGSHETLLAQPGLYSTFWQQQTGG